MFVLFQLTYFTQHNTLQFHPRRSKWWVFVVSNGWGISHCIHRPQLLYIHLSMDTEAPSTVWLSWTLLLETSGCRCPGVSLHLYLWGKAPAVQLLGRRAGLFLTLWGTSTQFPRVAAPGHIPANSAGGFLFLTSSPTLVVSRLVNFPHSHWCEVGTHCGFDLYFPHSQGCGAFSHVRGGHV